MIYVYAADISKLLDPLECPELMTSLSTERRHKIEALKQVKSRKQSLGAGLLLAKVLNTYGLSVADVRMNESGKPEADGICFNLSHSGELVVCAVGKKPVGCDVELIKDAPKRVAEKSLSDAEREHLQQFSGDEYNREFFRIWTRKESYLKMTGQGIRVPLHTLEIKACYVQEYELPEYQITVCAEENEFADIIWEKII